MVELFSLMQLNQQEVHLAYCWERNCSLSLNTNWGIAAKVNSYVCKSRRLISLGWCLYPQFSIRKNQKSCFPVVSHLQNVACLIFQPSKLRTRGTDLCSCWRGAPKPVGNLSAFLVGSLEVDVALFHGHWDKIAVPGMSVHWCCVGDCGGQLN